MPLYKKKPIQFLPIPSNLPVDAEVYQIRLTGEIFSNYESYLARLSYYKRKEWTCESTGKSDLTFEDALRSELNARKEVMDLFPESWIAQMLSLIHHNTLQLAELVDALYDKMKENPVFGEYVYVNSKLYIVIEVLDNKNLLKYSATPSTSSTDAIQVNDILETMVKVKSLDSLYQNTAVLDASGYPIQTEYTFPISKIKRDKQMLSKSSLRRFVKEIASKEFPDSPWIVKMDVAKDFALQDSPTQEVLEMIQKKQEIIRAKEAELAEKRKPAIPKPKIAFPIEDVELLDPAAKLSKPVPKGEEPPSRPIALYDLGSIPSECFLDLLSVWTFMGSFSQPLGVSTFTFEDFKNALLFKSFNVTPDLISETFASLICISCKEWTKILSTVNKELNSSSLQGRLSVSTSLESLPTEEPLVTDMVLDVPLDNTDSPSKLEFENLYESLNSDEQAAIDQWYKWAPNRWVSAHDKRYGVKVEASQRLKAWQVSLAGLIRDCIPIERLPDKFELLVLLLSVHEEEVLSEDDESRNDLQEDELIKNGDTQDTLQEEDQEEEDSDSQFTKAQYGLRTRNTRNRVMKVKLDDDDDDQDYEEEEDQVVLRKSSRKSTSITPHKASPPKNPTPPKPSKDIKKMLFEQLCLNSERGFCKISSKHKITLLLFMIETYAVSYPKVKNFIEENLEKMTDLKKEKRELTREIRLNKEAKEEFRKRELLRNKQGDFVEQDTPMTLVQEPEKTQVDSIQENEQGSEVDDNGNDNVDDHGHEVDEDPISSHVSRHESRKMKLLKEQKKREEEEAKRLEEWEKNQKESKQKQKEYRLRQEERKKIEDLEKSLAKRDALLDQQIRACSGCIRMRFLGKDRFHNKYWWFDGPLGASILPEAQLGDKPRPKTNKGVSNTLDWASGYLFVEDFGLEKHLHDWNNPQWDMIKQNNHSGRWGYYSEPIHLDQLLNWLDSRGFREKNLTSNLSKLEQVISDGMSRRNKEVLSKQEVVPVRSVRNKAVASVESFMDYVNRFAFTS